MSQQSVLDVGIYGTGPRLFGCRFHTSPSWQSRTKQHYPWLGPNKLQTNILNLAIHPELTELQNTMCRWFSSLTVQLLPFALDRAAACRVLRAISRAPSWVLFPPIKPPAWTKIQSLIPLSFDSASSRTPRHSSSRDSLGQEDRRANWLTDGHYVVSCSLPVGTLLFAKTRCAVHAGTNAKPANIKPGLDWWIISNNQWKKRIKINIDNW